MTRALVLIHGIGEQRPMETMWRFLRGVFGLSEDGTGCWQIVQDQPIAIVARSKPDRLSGNFELRRINVEARDEPDKSPFEAWHCYELFWQHLFREHGFLAILDWLLEIIDPRRRLRSIRLNLIRILLYIAIVGAATILSLHELFPDWIRDVIIGTGEALLAWIWGWKPFPRMAIIFAAFVIAVLVVVVAIRSIRLGSAFFLDAVGDAASYLDGHPRNVVKRNVVRKAGRELVDRLHAEQRPRYSEIIVVGHSLDSVIGYDVLYSAWQDIDRTVINRALVEAIEGAAEPLLRDSKARHVTATEQLRDKFRACQQQLFQQLNGKLAEHWRVSRFVTLGSPLTHAQFLLASNAEEIERRKKRREFPTCPPTREDDSSKYRFSFDDPTLTLHHAALFAPTIWTNIYFPQRCLLGGDLVGGPVTRWFGHGIEDIRLPGKGGHTSYWKKPAAVAAIRHAVGLRGRPCVRPRPKAAGGAR